MFNTTIQSIDQKFNQKFNSKIIALLCEVEMIAMYLEKMLLNDVE